MNQSFDDSNIDLDIDSLSEPMGFADGGIIEAMHLTPYGETNQEGMGYQDSHSMPQLYAEGGDVDIGDYSIPKFRDRTASQMLRAFADGGAVQGRPLGGMFDLGIGNPADRGMSAGQAYALAPGNGGQATYNANIAKIVTENINKTPSNIPSIAQKYGVSPGDINTALGQTLESRFRQEPSYQQTTTASGQLKDLFGPATMLTGGTGMGANFEAPIVTSRPRTLIDATPTLSASQQHARNLVTGDTALNEAFARTGLAKDPATFYDYQQRMTSGSLTPDQLRAQFDPMAYEIRVKEAYKNIGREGMGNDLSAYHPSNMGEMYKAYFKSNATQEEMDAINQQYSTGFGSNWDLATANRARTEVLIPGLQAQDYYKRNSDVAAAFATALKANPQLDYVGFAKNHHDTVGANQGRVWNASIGVGEFTAPKAEDFKTIDSGGYNYWMNQLKEGKISGADFEKLFYGATANYAGPYQDLYKGSMDKANELIKARGLNIATGVRQTLPGVTGYANGGAVDLLESAPNNLPSLQLPTLRDAQGNEYILQNGARYYKNSSGSPDPSMQGGSDEYVDSNPSWSGKTPTERAEYYQDPKNALMAAVTQLGQKGFALTAAGILQNLFNPSIQPAEAAIARGETPQQTEQMAKNQVDADQGAAVGDGNTGSYTSDNGGSFSPSDAGYGVYARGGYVKKPKGAASYKMSAPVRLAEGGEVDVTEAPSQESRVSAADTLKKLGLSVARGAPQIVTGAVDLAAMPFTMTGMIKPEDVVLSTEYLTKKGLLPPVQKGVVNETIEMLSSAVNPAGAVKGSAAIALGMMKNAAGKTLSKQLELPLEPATKGVVESPTIRAYTGHTREIVGPYDVDRASRSADMGPGLYLTDDAEYASRSATKRVDRLPGNDVSPAVYPVDIEKSKILMHDKQYPREVLDKLRKFSGKVQDTPGATVSGEYIYEQIRKANIPKTMMPGVFKLMGFQGAEFLPGGVSNGKSYVVYDTADTAKGAYTKKKFKDGGEATADFIKKSSKRR